MHSKSPNLVAGQLYSARVTKINFLFYKEKSNSNWKKIISCYQKKCTPFFIFQVDQHDIQSLSKKMNALCMAIFIFFLEEIKGSVDIRRRARITKNLTQSKPKDAYNNLD
jgi:hypothetical protein